jgi:type I restriction enzyme R subunit
MTQTEAQLEEGLVQRLKDLGWTPIAIGNGAELKSNLKSQIEAHNDVSLSDDEFTRVLNHLDKGNVFEKAERLRDRMALNRDDGTVSYLQFLNSEEWCKNQCQVATQIRQAGALANRYDVTLLINGLPLAQVELKRRGMELKEAFNQINRYQRDTFWSDGGLFQYVQVFVISNGVNTKYYANNRDQDFKQTFFWSDVDNNPIKQLDAFADAFLEKCHLSKMIAKYTVLHQSDRVLMILRPYQFYAVEAIDARVKAGRQNGYIWHTTGSGKTLTSFKAAQLLTENPKVDKVLFVVDRADLDYQTTKEFNHFAEGSVDGTDNTKALVKQMAGANKLIVTTIQKLNNAINRDQYEGALSNVKDGRVVFIFDECHRSQFGETHRSIAKFFSKAQMFGFTGTPIFDKNSVGNRTTADLFEKRLHSYLITDAISDQNVLKFAVEYWGRLKRRDGSLIDEEVSGIDTKEFFENPDRIENVVNWIIANHDRKTRGRQFGAMLCVASVDALVGYYEAFKRKAKAGEHSLRVATIFTTAANEEDADSNGLIGEPSFELGSDNRESRNKREQLKSFVQDYNSMFGVNESVGDSRGFYSYYNALAKRMKDRDRKSFAPGQGLDILIVVNMFLTGFDAKTLNTLYVDKNLRFHGLIQAFSRTNRILGQVKSQGNIVCFRNLKAKTDEAVTLFSDKKPQETILLEPFEAYKAKFDEAVSNLNKIAPTPSDVDDLMSENDLLAFVQAFRTIIRLRNTLASFVDFDPEELPLSPQEFDDFKSKYLDLHDRFKSTDRAQKTSIIEDVDFELELIRRDDINVAYILELIAELDVHESQTTEAVAAHKQRIVDLLSSESQLRSKRELIEDFIEKQMAGDGAKSNMIVDFVSFWESERSKAIESLCSAEGLPFEKMEELISRYQFSRKLPLSDEVIASLKTKPSILQRKKTAERVINGMVSIIETFDEDLGNLQT